MTRKKLRQMIMEKILEEKSKEYYCHVQFVTKIGLQLARKYKVNLKIIEIACLLHDIGRDCELDGEDHGDAGARITSQLLQGSNLSESEISIIVSCIKKHNKDSLNLTQEEKIVMSADCASKVLYHEAFMLMCKKTTYQEKLEWGKKYLEKGYHKIPMPEFQSKIKKRYEYHKINLKLLSNFF